MRLAFAWGLLTAVVVGQPTSAPVVVNPAAHRELEMLSGLLPEEGGLTRASEVPYERPPLVAGVEGVSSADQDQRAKTIRRIVDRHAPDPLTGSPLIMAAVIVAGVIGLVGFALLFGRRRPT